MKVEWLKKEIDFLSGLVAENLETLCDCGPVEVPWDGTEEEREEQKKTCKDVLAKLERMKRIK